VSTRGSLTLANGDARLRREGAGDPRRGEGGLVGVSMFPRGMRNARSVLAGGRWLAALTVLALFVLPGAAQASGMAKPVVTFGSPSPAEGATLTTGSVQFAFTYDRTPKQTKTVACVLSGPTASSGACNAPAATRRGSSSGASYGNLANGAYAFTATVTLTDGGTFSATRHFTVAVTSLTVTTTEYGCGGTCWGAVSGSGLAPGAQVVIYSASNNRGWPGGEVGAGAADANGNFSGNLGFTCGVDWTGVYVASTTSSGAPITSNVVNSPCS